VKLYFLFLAFIIVFMLVLSVFIVRSCFMVDSIEQFQPDVHYDSLGWVRVAPKTYYNPDVYDSVTVLNEDSSSFAFWYTREDTIDWMILEVGCANENGDK